MEVPHGGGCSSGWRTKVISSCPAPYSVLRVRTSTPTASIASSMAKHRPATLVCCSVTKISGPAKAGCDQSELELTQNSSSLAPSRCRPWREASSPSRRLHTVRGRASSSSVEEPPTLRCSQ